MGVLAEWSFIPLICGIAFMFLLFPTGHLPSPRWRPVAGLCLLLIALTLIGFLVQPKRVQLPAPGGISLSVQNPLGVRSLPGPLATVLIGTISQAWFVFIALMAASTVAMTIRYRSGGRELRQQIKWVAFTAATAIGCSVVVLVSMDIGGKSWAALTTAADVVVSAIGLAGFPIAIAIAILKTACTRSTSSSPGPSAYGLLSAALTAVYISIVVSIGTLAGYAGGPAPPWRRRSWSRCSSIRCASVPTCWRTASSTAGAPRPTRCSPTSPRTWPVSSTPTPRLTGWPRARRGDRGRARRGLGAGRRRAITSIGLASRCRTGSRARDGDPLSRPGRPWAGRPGDRRVSPGRTARRHHAGQGQERTGIRRGGQAAHRSGLAGWARAQERQADRRVAGHDRRSACVAAAASACAR